MSYKCTNLIEIYSVILLMRDLSLMVGMQLFDSRLQFSQFQSQINSAGETRVGIKKRLNLTRDSIPVTRNSTGLQTIKLLA